MLKKPATAYLEYSIGRRKFLGVATGATEAGHEPRIAMPHEVLQQPEVVPLVAQGVACAVAEHVGPDAAKPRTLASFADEVVDRLARHRLPPLGDEQPRQVSSRSAR